MMPIATIPVTHLVRRVQMKNYRSIEACNLELGSLTFLVGANGAGKSNFLDGLRFITDALRTSLDHALRDRGGIKEVRRRSGGHPTHFAIRLDVRLDDQLGFYAFEVGARAGGGFEVSQEECQIGGAHYKVRRGELALAPASVSPPASSDRLYLVHAAGFPEFRGLYDALSHMGFYNLSPDRMREHQPPDQGDVLARDGSNLASVLDRLAKSSPDVKQRIEEYLGRVVPGIEGVDSRQVGHMETLEFRQRVEGQSSPWRFPAIDMSDGTLRALGVLVAVFQPRSLGEVPLVGLEEPETSLHPAASALLLACLREAAARAQMVVTSHSPDLLDDPDLEPDAIVAVTAREGRSEIAHIDQAGRSALRDRLYTAGELLRSEQLQPDVDALSRPHQLVLFGRDDEG